MLSNERMGKVIIEVVKTPVGEILLGALDGKSCWRYLMARLRVTGMWRRG